MSDNPQIQAPIVIATPPSTEAAPVKALRRIVPYLIPQQFPEYVLCKLEENNFSFDEANLFLAAKGTDGATFVLDYYLPAAWLHDYLYRTGKVPRKLADELFYVSLREIARMEDNVLARLLGAAIAYSNYYGVRAFGWLHYKDKKET